METSAIKKYYHENADLIGLTGLRHPSSIALDTIYKQIFVSKGVSNTISVYASTDRGNIALVRTISHFK